MKWNGSLMKNICDLIKWSESHVESGPKQVLDIVVKKAHEAFRK